MFVAITRLSLFSLKQCIIKQLLDWVSLISEIIKVSVSVIGLRPSASADNTYFELDSVPDITK